MNSLGLNEHETDDRRTEPDRRTPERGQALAEWIRWGVTIAIAGLISYFTVLNEVGRIDEREKGHFEELLRVVTEIRTDVREIRNPHP